MFDKGFKQRPAAWREPSVNTQLLESLQEQMLRAVCLETSGLCTLHLCSPPFTL